MLSLQKVRSEVRKIRDKRGVRVASLAWAAICKNWDLGHSSWHGLGLDSTVKLAGEEDDEKDDYFRRHPDTWPGSQAERTKLTEHVKALTALRKLFGPDWKLE